MRPRTACRCSITTLGPSIPRVVLIGNPDSSIGYTILDFLSRNGVPYEWVDLEEVDRLPVVVSPSEMDPGLLPICILPRSNAAVQTQQPIHRRRRASMAAGTLLLSVPTGDFQGATADGSSTPVNCAQVLSNRF